MQHNGGKMFICDEYPHTSSPVLPNNKRELQIEDHSENNWIRKRMEDVLFAHNLEIGPTDLHFLNGLIQEAT
jgi:hypothetical protein